MKSTNQLGRFGALAILGIAAAEVLIMVSPFAGFLYSTIHFGPFLGFFSGSPLTAWLDGFFLNHSVVTRSTLLEWNRTIGHYVFALGLWGFFISAIQVYGNKITKRGVAKGLLYRFVRHPQYLCLGVAGLGLLTIWPRFLLLGVWITMLFVYAGLARFEERCMEERFGEDYRRFAATRGSFLPGSPVRRVFQGTFCKLRPSFARWVAAYVVCLTIGFALGFALRVYTRANAAILFLPKQDTVIVSAWPQPRQWMTEVFEAAVSDVRVQYRLRESKEDKPVIITILPPRYRMKGMFYQVSAEHRRAGFSPAWMGRMAAMFLVPVSGVTFPEEFMGVDPDRSHESVELVFSLAEKAYKENLALDEALDPSVRLKPFLVVDVLPSTGEVTGVVEPLRQNAWGPNVVMPIL